MDGTSSEEYLCAVFFEDHFQQDYGIYRWKLTGRPAGSRPQTTYYRLPSVSGDKLLSVGAFASVGAKIYMIGGSYEGYPHRCSTDIYVVDTDKLHTKDATQIVEKIPSVLNSKLSSRDAVVVGGKIYTFPAEFCFVDESEGSRFEVFDPVGKTARLLPEPEYGRSDCYAVVKNHILFCSDGGTLFEFDTARESRGWIDISADFLRMSIGINGNQLLPLFPTLIDRECAATTLGGDDDGSRLFATVSGVTPSDALLKFRMTSEYFHGIVEFAQEPLRIAKWFRICGIPRQLVGKPCFSHGGSVFFTYIQDDSPKSGTRVWIFRKYSLSYHSEEDEDYYSAHLEFSFREMHPCSYDYDSLASFVMQLPSSS